MLIDCSSKNGYQILRIKEELSYKTDVEKIQVIIDNCIKSRLNNIAISFFPNGHLYTPPIRLLVQSYRTISANKGKMAVIAPSKEMMEEISEILKLLGLADKIALLRSEDELPS
jgi:hypothetical protein